MLFKHFVLTLSLISYSFVSFGQTFGNEWIQYDQKYYAFKIVQDGIYRLDYNALDNAGVPLSSFSTENIQIFGREKEIPIHIEDGNDSSLDPGDYILFYAERNDGWLDSTLYLDPQTIGNPEISLYNDTIHYYFTWNNSTNNLRYTVETDINYAPLTPKNYIWSKSHYSFTNEYHEGEKVSDASSSFFVAGEGWSRGKVDGVAYGSMYTANINVSTPYPYTGPGAPNAEFQGLSVSNSNANYSGIGNHHLRWRVGSSSITLLDTIFTGYRQIRCNETFAANQLVNGNTPLRFDIINDQGATTDYQAYSYYHIKYPRIPNLQGNSQQAFWVENETGQSKIRLDLTNAGGANPLVLIHGDVPRIVPITPNGSLKTCLIPNSSSGQDQFVYYQDSSLISTINSVSAVNGSGTFTNFISSSIDSALLMIYHTDLAQASMDYASYRSSIAGGSYNVILANVDELYHQFGGGIEKHINGIRRFAHYIHTNASQKPAGLFLMGKGIREANYNSFTSDGPGTRFSASRFQQSLIPSFGHPSSDVSITSNLVPGKKWSPLMSTGRISARTNSELANYLNKVIEYEQQQDQNDIYDTPNKDWQKQVIHFAGGSSLSEQQLFQLYMNNFKDQIEESLFGANVMSVYKSTSNPLDPTILSSVTDRISQGVSLMSYLGHSSATNSGFEINLDDPLNWNNTGKYPLMLVNSCYNGNIFQLSNSKSEEFVQVANYGAIGYIASTGVGFAHTLAQYSQSLYNQMGYTSYGQNVGDQMKYVIEGLESSVNNLLLESTCSQMVLNGDPMIHLNWHEKPEIELLESNVFFTPENIDLTTDSIEMHIVLTNLGKSVTNQFTLEVVRNFPQSSTDSVYAFLIDGLNYKDTFSFKMPLQANIGIGLNTFSISADIPSQIGEQYDEIGNNQITKSLFLNVDGILPVIPYDFAVVPYDTVTVKASTINPIADFNTYRFEIDTTDLFNSPEKRYALVSGYGGVKTVHPSEWLWPSSGSSAPLTCTDSTVYFWRVAVEDPNPIWTEYSFQYIPGRIGWGQDHFFQFKKDGFNAINYDRPTRKRYFEPNVKDVKVSAYSSPVDWAENSWYIGGNLQEYGLGTNTIPKLHVGVVDPVTLESWGTKYTPPGGPTQNPNNDFGNNNNENAWGLNRSFKMFTFYQNDPVELDSFQSMINNHVPNGHYIVIYTPLTTSYDQWIALDSADMFGLFENLGSTEINATQPNRPFAFFCQKGNPSSVVETVAQFNGGNALIQGTIYGVDYTGTETSTLIGPSAEWGNVYWKQDPEESPTADSTMLRIMAYDISENYQFTIDTVFTLNDSIVDLENLVSAADYPYIKLQAYHNDTVGFTPAQIDRWHVLYQPLPEAAIDGSTLYTWTLPTDTLEEGQAVDFAVDVKNIYDYPMDSLLISYWIEDENQVKHFVTYPRQDSLRVGETLRDTITINTVGLSGLNSLWMEVNPYINGSLYITDQPEQEHFNNILQLPFYVNPDDREPILDVTFNGMHILNGDIIDPNSEILISLKDDNEFLIMDDISDTTLFGVYLTNPLGEQVRIPFIDGTGNTIMQWIPATQQNKRFKIIWPSEFDMDGKYTLYVQGSDRSGNLSGDLEYRVTFEVIHESTITHMMNYPNPFTTSTRFVFTLTGSEEPDEVIIQIMTVSGRVVREITEDQLGPIHIGRNISEYAWDGTDEFGDPLANGVYLYRVKAQINGEDIKHRESGADSHFTKDFGKMYLMR